MPIYRIKDWNIHFENNRTREMKRLDWVPIPNKMDGEGYAELVDHENGAAHLGAWLAILEIASRCETRGTLIRDGKIMTPRSLAMISRLPAGIFAELLPRLLDIGWVEEISQEGATPPQDGAGKAPESRREVRDNAEIPQEGAPRDARAEGNGTEGNGREEKRTHRSAPIEIRKPVPEDCEARIRKLATDAPDPQYFEAGVNRAAEFIASSGNPETELAAMEVNIPEWFAAMIDGRAKMRPMLYLISDRDYLRRPREPTKQKQPTGFRTAREQQIHEELMRD